MRRKRRNHTTAFKAKVALDALKGELTQSELASKYDLHQNQITEWKKLLLDNADQLFGQHKKIAEDTDSTIKDLHAKIGQLTMERDFLENGLERIHGSKRKG